MTEQSFSLVPFPSPTLPAISISGTSFLQENHLALQYCVTGNIEEVLLPFSVPSPNRQDDLWKATCFEFFLAFQDKPEYWEFNMSPSGAWNIYHMDSYRRIGFREELAISRLPFAFKQGPKGYFLNVSADLTPILHAPAGLQMAITAIIQTKDGDESYWALSHPGATADFHQRESFTLMPAGPASLSELSVRAG
jgi:hypothetical protein